MIIKNHFNYQEGEASFEVSSPEIVTIQGDTFSIKELVQKMNQGLVPQYREGHYPDEEDIDALDYGALSNLDIAERAEIKAEIDQRVSELQEAVKKAEKQAQNKQKEAHLELLKNKIREEIKNEPKKTSENA